MVPVPRDEHNHPQQNQQHCNRNNDRKQQVWERVQAIARDANISADQLPELALRFCLSHPAVSTVIPGMRSTRHVEANTAASEAGPLSEQTLKDLRPHRWVRSFYWT